jgi:hypothetical protein
MVDVLVVLSCWKKGDIWVVMDEILRFAQSDRWGLWVLVSYIYIAEMTSSKGQAGMELRSGVPLCQVWEQFGDQHARED